MKVKRITRIIFLIINIVAAVVFLLSCMAPYLDPKKWWLISLIGLGFAFIIVTLIAFVFFWLVFKPKYIFISLVPMLIGWKGISVFFAFHIPDKFDYNKPEKNTVRVVQWNVARFKEWKRNNNKGSQTRLKMMDLIKEQNADVLCMQEFFTSTDSIYYNNLNHVMRELGYPYFYYSWDDDGYLQWNGQIIFSRYPFVDTGMIRFPKPSIPEALIHADIVVNQDTLRIYTTHLQSVRFKPADFDDIEKIKNTDDGMVQKSKGIFSKLRYGLVHRSTQADILKAEISKSPHPFVLTGDFNDVPNSYTYFKLKGNELKDAFLATGFGVGKTFSDIAPTLRIDYMFVTKDVGIKQFNRVVRDYSDHYMLVGDFVLN